MTLRMPRCSQILTATPKLRRTNVAKNGYTNLMFYTSASWLIIHLRKSNHTRRHLVSNFTPITFCRTKRWKFALMGKLAPGSSLRWIASGNTSFDHRRHYRSPFKRKPAAIQQSVMEDWWSITILWRTFTLSSQIYSANRSKFVRLVKWWSRWPCLQPIVS